MLCNNLVVNEHHTLIVLCHSYIPIECTRYLTDKSIFASNITGVAN